MDIKQAEDLKTSLLWSAVLEEIDHKIRFESNRLRTCIPSELQAIQVAIQCWEALKRLPEDVIERES